MYATKFISIIFLLYSTSIYAQRDSIISDIKVDTTFIIKVNPKLAPFIVHFSAFAVQYDKNNPYFGKIYYTVEIKKNKNGKLIQTIKSDNWLPDDPLSYDYGYDDRPIQEAMAVDINFDGYKDLRFLTGAGSNAYAVNQTYDYYVYNPIKNKFVYNEDISILHNPIPFPKENIVRSYLRNAFSGTDGTISEYKWSKNKLILLQSFNYKLIMSTCNSDTDCKFTRIIKYYKNNRIVKTKTKIVNITEIPKYHLLFW